MDYPEAITQEQLRTVTISKHTLNKLLPTNFPKEKYLKSTNNFEITKTQYDYKITFNEDYLINRIYYFKEHKAKYIKIPLNLIKHAMKRNNLKATGLKFLITVLCHYYAQNPRILFKPSNLINLTGLNTSRTKEVLIDRLNIYFAYLQKINLISSFTPFTKETLKADLPLKISLNPLKDIKLE